MAFNLGITSKKIPVILGVLLLLGGLVAAVYMVGQSQGIFIQAGPTATPRQVRISNVKSDSFTVSWVTDTSVTGSIKFGTAANKLNKAFSDDRDQLSGTTGQFTTHFVTLKSLKPNTKYYFQVGAGSAKYGKDGTAEPYVVTTTKNLSNKPAADAINGKVILGSGQPAPGVIVYVEAEGGAALSALTKTSGVWSVQLSNMTTADFSKYLGYDKQNTKLTITVQGADLGTATATATTANAKPVPDITLGQNQNFTAVATPSGEIAGTTIEILNNAYSVKELSVDPGTVITVLNKDGVPHSVSETDKTFETGLISGGGNATFSAPLAAGVYSFSDAANPGVESLMGKLTVKGATTGGEAASGTGGFGGLVGGGNEAYEATLSVKLVSIDEGELIATNEPEIIIEAPKGEVVKITVNSAVTQTTTQTAGSDQTINWTPPEGLEPGQHTVTLEYTDANGVLQKIVRTFTVLGAETTGGTGLPSFTATKSGTLSPTPTSTSSGVPLSSMPSTESGVPESGVLTPTITILMMGIGLFLTGLIWQIRLLTIRL